MRIAYIIPTRDRPEVLSQALAALGSLPRHDAQVIVADNASGSPAAAPRTLDNGLTVETVHLYENAGAAARNQAVLASDPACEWVVMLDDDSAPLSLGHLAALEAADVGVAAVAAEIWLPPSPHAESPITPAAAMQASPRAGAGALESPAEPATFGVDTSPTRSRRESGGLPEVFIGCGVAIRRAAFLDSGGYDPAFGYYAEEYDLAARFLLAGLRIELDRRFQVLHRKVAAGRDMDLILHRLVRNNGWVMQRYAPERRRIGEIAHVLDRYGRIASKEHARSGYRAGRRELLTTLRTQHRTPLAAPLWDRFTGKTAAMKSLERAWIKRGFRTAAIVDEGKNAHVIRAAMRELGVREVPPDQANAIVIGTLSPGPMLDAFERRRADGRVICPWDLAAPSAARPVAA